MNYIGTRLNATLGKASMLLVPLSFSLSELFHPITLATPAEEIQSAGQYATRWLVAHLLALVALLLIPFLVMKLYDYVEEKYQKLAIPACVLAIMGTVLTTGLLVFDFVILDMSANGALDDMVALYVRLNESIFGVLFLKIGPLVFLLGLLGMVLSMFASLIVKKWESLFILVGLLIYGLAGPLFPMQNGHILVNAGAIVMLIGFALILRKPQPDLSTQ